MLLYGDRVRERELAVIEQVRFEPPAGWQLLLRAAAQAAFVVTEP